MRALEPKRTCFEISFVLSLKPSRLPDWDGGTHFGTEDALSDNLSAYRGVVKLRSKS